MFGEEYMLGVNKQTIDSKGRITIPNDTKVECDDQLVIINKDTFLEIWHLNQLKKILMELEEKRAKAKNIEELEYYQSIINSITVNIIKSSNVDEQRRINIGVEYFKKLKELNNKEITIERMGKYIRIWPSNNFETYKKEINKKALKK